MKRTNVVLDEDVVARAKELTGIKTTRGVIDRALRQLVQLGDQRKILALRGKVDWQGDLDDMRRPRALQ
jgi:Arc/MetJ family transcription regulator